MPIEILVAEDSLTQAEQLRALLEGEGYRPTVTRSGEEALERLQGASFDLLITDVVMPGISGYELCRMAKRERPDLPVLLLTSLTNPMDIVRGLEAGADNYITKPYEPEHLLARLRRVVDNRHLRRGVRTSMGVNFTFLGNAFTITSDKEQILDLLLSSVEDTVRANQQLEARQRELSDAHARLEMYATEQAREARRSTERYHSLMQNAGDAIFVLDGDGAVVELNARAADLLGVPMDRALYRPLEEVLGTVGAGVAETDDAGLTRDLRLRLPDGEERWIELSTAAVRLEDDVLTLAIARDVTERRAAEETLRRTLADLRESEEKLQAIFAASPVAIMLLDLDLRLRGWNRAAEEIFGWSEEEVVGEPLPFMADADWREAGALRDRALAGESVLGVEVRRRRKGGAPVDLSLSVAPFRQREGEAVGLVALAIDITERKQKEEELRQAHRMEAIGRLTGGIAHDFNNVLSTIHGSAQLMLLDLPPESPIRDDIEEIQKAAGRATALTRHLLAFSRKQVLQPRVLDLNRLIRDLEGMLLRLAQDQIELRLELDPGVGPIQADATQVQQVIMNLVVNACQATPGGGELTLRTASAPPASSSGEDRGAARVLLSVEDSGEGMSEAVRERIFEPFFTTKPEGQGTGLGLSTVHGIVHQSGGTIEVESEVGVGTTFRVFLPVVDKPMDAAEEAPPAVEPLEGSETILLAEDDPSVRSVAARILRRYGYTVMEASSGAEALEAMGADQGDVALLLTDLMMPEMSGIELAAHLRKGHQDIPVLFMSGYSERDVLESIRPSDTPILEKPFTPESLLRGIRKLLDRRG